MAKLLTCHSALLPSRAPPRAPQRVQTAQSRPVRRRTEVVQVDELLNRMADPAATTKQRSSLIDALLAEVTQAPANSERVAFPGFGSFEVRDRAARTGRNPLTGEELQIAATKAPAFKPAAALRQRVNQT